MLVHGSWLMVYGSWFENSYSLYILCIASSALIPCLYYILFRFPRLLSSSSPPPVSCTPSQTLFPCIAPTSTLVLRLLLYRYCFFFCLPSFLPSFLSVRTMLGTFFFFLFTIARYLFDELPRLLLLECELPAWQAAILISR